MIRSLDKKLRGTHIAEVIFGILAVALIIRAFYGFCQSDESFYVATAGRFSGGDLVFADEWHPTQLAALITMPVYKLYTLITGGTYGVLVFFRILYVVLTFVEACIVYRMISNSGLTGDCSIGNIVPALMLSLFLMLYCHLNMPTLSYYTMSFHFFITAFLVVYWGWQMKGTHYIAGGVLFALSVLSLPSLAVVYIIIMCFLSVSCILVSRLRRPLLLFTAGILIPLVIFIVYLYASGNSIAGLLANLPYIMSDGEHDRGYVESFKVFFRAISDVFGKIYYLSIVLVILALLTYVNKTLSRYLRPYILLADTILFIYYVVIACRYTGFMNTAFALFVFPLFFLTEKKNWYVFLTMFMGGLIFSMTYSFSSFCDLYVLSIGHGIAAGGGILLIWDYICEKSSQVSSKKQGGSGVKDDGSHIADLADRIFVRIAVASAAVLILITAILRFSYVYRDDRIGNLDTRISSGPAAGLITSREHKEQYESVFHTIEKYTSKHDNSENNIDKILFSKILPWGYTASGLKAAAPDTWRNEISSERLMEYYVQHEMPDLVFVLDADVASYESSGDVEADPTPNENDLSGRFAAVLSSEYKRHEEEKCIVYVRK